MAIQVERVGVLEEPELTASAPKLVTECERGFARLMLACQSAAE